MKRVAPFIAALIFVIVIGTLVWAFLDNGDDVQRHVLPTPGPGAQAPVLQTLTGALVTDEPHA